MSAIAQPNPNVNRLPVAAEATGPGEPAVAVDELNADHGLPRFFYAAGLALVISAIHGSARSIGVDEMPRPAQANKEMAAARIQ